MPPPSLDYSGDCEDIADDHIGSSDYDSNLSFSGITAETALLFFL